MSATAARRKRRLRLAVLLVALFLVGVHMLVVVLATASVERERRTLDARIAAERARVESVRYPCLHGEPVDEPVGVALAPLLLEAREDALAPLDNRVYARAELHTPRVLELVWQLVPRLREALRRIRATAPALDAQSDTVSLVPWRRLFRAVLVVAVERREARDFAKSAALALDAAQLGLVMSREKGDPAGRLADAMIGASFEREAFTYLGATLARAPVDAEVRREVLRDLDRLAAAEPTGEEVCREHALATRRGLLVGRGFPVTDPSLVAEDGTLVVSGWPRLLPRSVLLAHAFDRIDGIFGRVADVAPAARRTALAAGMEAVDRAPLGWNPAVRVAVRVVNVESFRECAAAEALARAVLALDERSQGGLAPQPAEVKLPQDPFSPKGERLRYERYSDRAWSVWSVGPNGRDDYVLGSEDVDDIALVRRQ